MSPLRIGATLLWTYTRCNSSTKQLLILIVGGVPFPSPFLFFQVRPRPDPVSEVMILHYYLYTRIISSSCTKSLPVSCDKYLVQVLIYLASISIRQSKLSSRALPFLNNHRSSLQGFSDLHTTLAPYIHHARSRFPLLFSGRQQLEEQMMLNGNSNSDKRRSWSGFIRCLL